MLSTSTTFARIRRIALGCFDGLHLGHEKLLEHLRGEESAMVIIDKFKSKKLCDGAQRELLSEILSVELDFESVKDLSGEEFLRLLREKFKNLELIVVGYDFRFGKNRLHQAEDIEALSGIKTLIVPEFKRDGLSVHTQMIKRLLSEGEVARAAEFLGRFYSIKGQLVRGQGLGRRELFATLNLKSEGYFLPKFGVYAGFCRVRGGLHAGVIFLGLRGSDGAFSLETHILEPFSQEVEEGEALQIFFLSFLRENEKFDNLQDLKQQISADIKRAKEFLKKPFEAAFLRG